nr:EOG090X0A8E [Macrothrix elegans]
MPEQNGTDELFDVKAQFYIGNYQSAINEAQKLKLYASDLKTERDIYVFRSYIALRKYGVVMSEISSRSPVEFQPLKTLAEYFAYPNKRNEITVQLDEQVSTNLNSNNYLFLIVASTIYYNEGNFENVLKIMHQSDHLECHALMLQTYLKMDRIDLAKRELKVMQEIDEDAVLTQLSSVWVNLLIGGDKFQEAYYTLQELADKYSTTALLLNGQASCFINQGKYEEAESVLQEALEKDSNYTDTYQNLVVLGQLSGKTPDVCNRYFSQLNDSAPEHSIVKDFLLKEKEFDTLTNNYIASVI